jgi:hypothetical protein
MSFDADFAITAIERSTTSVGVQLAKVRRTLTENMDKGYNLGSFDFELLIKLQAEMGIMNQVSKIAHKATDLHQELARWIEDARENLTFGQIGGSTSEIRNGELRLEREALITVIRRVSSLV